MGIARVSPGLPETVPSLGICVSPTDQSCRMLSTLTTFHSGCRFWSLFSRQQKRDTIKFLFCASTMGHTMDLSQESLPMALPRNTCTTLAKPKVQKDCGVQDENCSAEHSVPCHTQPRDTGTRNKPCGITCPGETSRALQQLLWRDVGKNLLPGTPNFPKSLGLDQEAIPSWGFKSANSPALASAA